MSIITGGHYVAFAKNTLRNQWFEYNDMHVTPVSAGTVASAEGYVLFYRYSVSCYMYTKFIYIYII